MKPVICKNVNFVLLATVACGLMLPACSSMKKDDSWEKSREAQAKYSVRRPVNNQEGMEAVAMARESSMMHAPAMNPQMGGEQAPSESFEQAQPAEPAGPAPEKKGLFSFMYRDEPQTSMSGAPRQMPNENSQMAAMDGAPSSYNAAAPVANVAMQPVENQGFPELSDTPPTPERIDQNKGAQMMAEMQADNSQMQGQRQQMNAQVEAEGFGESAMETTAVAEAPAAMVPAPSAAPAPRADVASEFAALVAKPAGAPAAEPVMASAEPMAAPAGGANWEPAPLVTPAAPAAPASGGNDEWVDVRGNAQQAVPVPEVQVGSAPQAAGVSSMAMAGDWNGGGGVMLNAPAGNGRLLAESRYASRNQAVNSQRYSMRGRSMRRGF